MIKKCNQIDPTATATFFGLIIASYNLGSALASPILGYYSNCIREIRRPVVVGVCINIVGNIFTAFVEIFPYHRKWVLLTSRFITGIGAGKKFYLLSCQGIDYGIFLGGGEGV